MFITYQKCNERACFGPTWIAIDSNYTNRKVFLRNPSNQHMCIYLCAEVGGRIPTFDFRYNKLKILPFLVTNVGKDGTFRAYSCFSTIDPFRSDKIVSGNGAFQEI